VEAAGACGVLRLKGAGGEEEEKCGGAHSESSRRSYRSGRGRGR
jgi:hypothetical protein